MNYGDFDANGATQVRGAMQVSHLEIMQKLPGVNEKFAHLLAGTSYSYQPNTEILKEDAVLGKIRYFQVISGTMHIGHPRKEFSDGLSEYESFVCLDGVEPHNAILFPRGMEKSAFTLFSGFSGCIVLMLDDEMMTGVMNKPENARRVLKNTIKIFKETCKHVDANKKLRHYTQPLFNLLFKEVASNARIEDIVFDGLVDVYLDATTNPDDTNAIDLNSARVTSLIGAMQEVYKVVKLLPTQ